MNKRGRGRGQRPFRFWAVVLAPIGLFLGWPGLAQSPAGVPQELPKVEFRFGAISLQAPIADTEAERERGLMYVKNLPDNEGMLFVMPHREAATFWMKDTLIPLAIAFLDARGVVLEIHEMETLDTTLTRSNSPQVAYALEMNRHWFALNGVKPGARLEAVNGKLPPPPR